MSFLYSILPEYTRQTDILTDVNSDGTVKSLEEFLNTVDSEVFEIISNSIKEILTYNDVYNIKEEYLPHFAYLLGYKWNYSIDLEIQRNLVANIIELYKRKGTKFSFNFNIYHLDPTVTLYEPYKDIFILNKSSFDIIDPETENFIWKQPVEAASTENITLSGLQTIDSYDLKEDNRVLVKDQTDPLENGVYTVAVGAWSRSSDTATNILLYKGLFFVKNGALNRNKGFICTTTSETEILFDYFTTTRVREYHLPSRTYYSWGILVVRLSEPIDEVYELLAMVRPAGWKLIIETEIGLFYSIFHKLYNINREWYVESLNISEDIYDEYPEESYNDLIESIQFANTLSYYNLIFMGQIFSLYGDYHEDLLGSVTLENIEPYNLYYETETNEFTLLRHPIVYTNYDSEVITP